MTPGPPPLPDGGGLSPVSDDDDLTEEFIPIPPVVPPSAFITPASFSAFSANAHPYPPFSGEHMGKYVLHAPYSKLGMPRFMNVFPTTSTNMGDTRTTLHAPTPLSPVFLRSSGAPGIPLGGYPFVPASQGGPPPSHPLHGIPLPPTAFQHSIPPHRLIMEGSPVPPPPLSTLVGMQHLAQRESYQNEIKKVAPPRGFIRASMSSDNEVTPRDIKRMKNDALNSMPLNMQWGKPSSNQPRELLVPPPPFIPGETMNNIPSMGDDITLKVDTQNVFTPAYGSGSSGRVVKMENNPSIDAEVRIFLNSLNRESISLEASRLKIDMTDAGALFTIIREEFLACPLNNPRKLTLFLFFSSLIEPTNSSSGPFRGNQVFLCELGFNLFLSKIRDELAEIFLEKDQYLRCIQNWRDKSIYSAEICDYLSDALARSGFSKYGELQFHSTFSTELMKLEALHDVINFSQSQHYFNTSCKPERTKLYKAEPQAQNLSGISIEDLEQDASNFEQVFNLSRLEIIALNRSILDVAALVEDNIDEMVSLKTRIQEL